MKRNCILVLGMGRSGTSALSGLFAHLGASPPATLMGPAPSNPKGHWESLAVVRLNDRMLAEAHSSWDDWHRFDFASLPHDRRSYYHHEIRAVLRSEYPSSETIVLKDPRIGRFVNLYIEALRDLEFSVVPVIVYRHHAAVAASLKARDGTEAAISELVWTRYLIDVEEATRYSPRVIVSYPDFLNTWPQMLSEIRSKFGMMWTNDIETETIQSTSAFLDQDLCHHSTNDATCDIANTVWPWTSRLYDALEELREGKIVAFERLDKIRDDFNMSIQRLGVVP